jgi:hypothetical protein
LGDVGRLHRHTVALSHQFHVQNAMSSPVQTRNSHCSAWRDGLHWLVFWPMMNLDLYRTSLMGDASTTTSSLTLASSCHCPCTQSGSMPGNAMCGRSSSVHSHHRLFYAIDFDDIFPSVIFQGQTNTATCIPRMSVGWLRA